MVAYSFHPRFVPLIESGRKRQTIRAHRKRHARPGERMQLYTGMRTRHCRKIISDPLCVEVENIAIDVPAAPGGGCQYRFDWWPDHVWATVDGLFAEQDGFAEPRDFHRFWLEHHGFDVFHGVLIRWKAPGPGT